jgi:hypothetical protein
MSQLGKVSNKIWSHIKVFYQAGLCPRIKVPNLLAKALYYQQIYIFLNIKVLMILWNQLNQDKFLKKNENPLKVS